MKVFDLHCDTLSELRYAERRGEDKASPKMTRNIDLEKDAEGRLHAAMLLPPLRIWPTPPRRGPAGDGAGRGGCLQADHGEVLRQDRAGLPRREGIIRKNGGRARSAEC